MQGQTVRESSRHLFRRPPHPSPACTPPPPPSHPTCQTPCSSAPWARHPCPCPCDLTALRCPRFWKQTPKRLLTTICITQGSIRRRSPLGTPQTHGYPPVGLDGVKHHRLALSQVCHQPWQNIHHRCVFVTGFLSVTLVHTRGVHVFIHISIALKYEASAEQSGKADWHCQSHRLSHRWSKLLVCFC